MSHLSTSFKGAHILKQVFVFEFEVRVIPIVVKCHVNDNFKDNYNYVTYSS